MKIFIFRRDFRLCDNSAFIKCLRDTLDKKTSDHRENILPIFIYNDDQIDDKKNAYFSNNAMQFLVESIQYLEQEIKQMGGKLYKLHVSKTENETDLLVQILSSYPNSSVYFNKDLTPFARERDNLLETNLRKKDINVYSLEDYTLFSIDEKKVKTTDNNAYKVFSPFYKKHKQLHSIVSEIASINDFVKTKDIPWFTNKNDFLDKMTSDMTKKEDSFYKKNDDISVNGGRKYALKILDIISKGDYKQYDKTRDQIYNEKGTTRLSAYLKFGCISIREFYWMVYKKYGISHALIREIYFREFYYHITWFYPHVLEGMKLKYKGKKEKNQNYLEIDIKWEKNKSALEKWKNGCTGTPLVDAAMRQLNQTGFMHNRGRMIVAMYLTKDLRINWREGEQYFASKLVDYDPSQNNAGWQWSASTGSDAQPYFRIMNPYTQQERFDKDSTYIKNWIPQLINVSSKEINKWEEINIRNKHKNICYPSPIVENHTKTAKETKKMFKSKKN